MLMLMVVVIGLMVSGDDVISGGDGSENDRNADNYP